MIRLVPGIAALIITLTTHCYGSGAAQDILNGRYSQDISKTTEYYYNNLIKGKDKLERTTIKQFAEIKNGLYIITQEMAGNMAVAAKSICYDLNYGAHPANAEIRFIEILNIFDYNYEIKYSGSNIEIITEYMNETYNHGYRESIKENVRVVFEFDEMNKLRSYKLIKQDTAKIAAE
jgi:hypothetical protein